MIDRWEKGRETVDSLLSEGRIERIQPNPELAILLLKQAETHLESARALAESDVPGAFQIIYDAARKSLAAILANQGLRSKGAGAHAVLYEVVHAQLHPPLGSLLDPFDWMRRLRNTTEYPDLDKPVAESSDLKEAIPATYKIYEVAVKVITQMPPY